MTYGKRRAWRMANGAHDAWQTARMANGAHGAWRTARMMYCERRA
ncbi:MAG: hypothetical protein RSD27_00965 [Ruthenibacterium sp.]